MKICPQCNTSFSCGSETSKACWCNHFPAIMPMDMVSACFCPHCLKKQIKTKIDQYVHEVIQGLRKSDAHLIPPSPFQEGIDYYIENGLMVFTAWYHLKRGKCCGNGCRHCPFDYRNVRK